MPYTWDDLRRDQALPLPPLERYDLAGQTAIVTGANTGIGYEIAKYLMANGAEKVIIACRNEKKGAHAVKTLTQETGRAEGVAEVWPLDLASFASVRSFVRRFVESGLPLHILVNNAAVCSVPKSMTEDGFDIVVQVDHLAPLLLSILLFPVLERTSASDKNRPSRCIWVSTEAAAFEPYVDLKDGRPVRELSTRPYDLDHAKLFLQYQQTKLSAIMTACEYARRIPSSANVVSALAVPGLVATELGQKTPEGEVCRSFDFGALNNLKTRTREEGAKTILLPTTYPVEKVWGDKRRDVPLFISMKAVDNLKDFTEDAANEELRKVVWDDSISLLGLKSGDVDSCFL
ncbi:NAD-P-binding protein [Dentipellis sp. KUC8613]|nr:NAD-P-binding protein [Dentipellis sp. KUC8613]